MQKIKLGLIFICIGLAYGGLIFDRVYKNTLGYLVEHKWIIPPVFKKTSPSILGRKTTILLYSITLIIIGLYLIWNREI